jgi:hypothetical protein
MITFYKCASCGCLIRVFKWREPRVHCAECGNAEVPGMEPDIWYAASEDYPPRKTEEEAEQVAKMRAVSQTFRGLRRVNEARLLVKGEGI